MNGTCVSLVKMQKSQNMMLRHGLIEAMLWNIASRALELGTNVILDFGFWAREEREDYRSRAKQLGASSEVHFLDVSEDELIQAACGKEFAAFAGKFLHIRRNDEAMDCVLPKTNARRT